MGAYKRKFPEPVTEKFAWANDPKREGKARAYQRAKERKAAIARGEEPPPKGKPGRPCKPVSFPEPPREVTPPNPGLVSERVKALEPHLRRNTGAEPLPPPPPARVTEQQAEAYSFKRAVLGAWKGGD